MRLLLVLLFALSLSAPALAQETNETTTNETNETPAGNETPGNETGGEAPAEPAGPLSIVLVAHQEGSAFFFTREGETEHNPTLNVQPGQKVTFTLKIASSVHNLNVNNEQKAPIMGEGEEASFEWTAPAEPTTVDYWCDPHKANGMRGKIVVGTPATGGGGGEEGEIVGDTIDLGQYDAACAGKKAPAAAAEGITGLPTLQDYIDACSATGEASTQTREKHAADYVLPIAWVLIAVGIGGVVWAHKYYKP